MVKCGGLVDSVVVEGGKYMLLSGEIISHEEKTRLEEEAYRREHFREKDRLANEIRKSELNRVNAFAERMFLVGHSYQRTQEVISQHMQHVEDEISKI